MFFICLSNLDLSPGDMLTRFKLINITELKDMEVPLISVACLILHTWHWTLEPQLQTFTLSLLYRTSLFLRQYDNV
jgi:hypothetical protein